MEKMTGNGSFVPTQRDEPGAAVKDVAQQREPLPGEVRPDLRSTPGAGPGFNQGHSRPTSEGGEVGFGRLSAAHCQRVSANFALEAIFDAEDCGRVAGPDKDQAAHPPPRV